MSSHAKSQADEEEELIKKEFWIDFVAGTLGGAMGVAVGHPLDTIKVRLQAQSSGSGVKRYSGTWNCLRTILREEKVWGLYKGMGSPIVGVAVINSLLFGVYGWFLHHFNEMPYINGVPHDTTIPSVNSIFWAGCASGFVNAFFSCPMELVKIRLQNQSSSVVTSATVSTLFASPSALLHSNPAASPHSTTSQLKLTPAQSFASVRPYSTSSSSSSHSASTTSISRHPVYSGLFDCCKQIYRVEGIKGFFRGLHVTVWREVPSYGCYFASYEIFSHMFTIKGQRLDVPSPGLLVAGGLAGVIGWLSTYPFDVVKTRIQSDLNLKHQNMFSCLRHIYRTEGIRALFTGMNATAIRAFPTNAATFYTVCYVKNLIENR